MPPRFTPRTLAQWPWVVVRLDCVLCRRRGCYRLARLAAKYGPEQSVDGLLRDLAHDCPWYNERPRKYEARCGVRFTDLEHAFPPADHPDEPVHRKRQPSRESVRKPKGSGRPPATYQDGVPSLSNWPDATLVLACETCGRQELFVVADLRIGFGPGMLMTDLRVALSAECPRRLARSMYDQCGVVLVRSSDQNETPDE